MVKTINHDKSPITQGISAQVGDGGGTVDDCRGDGSSLLRHQLPEWFLVETGEGKGDAAGQADGDDSMQIIATLEHTNNLALSYAQGLPAIFLPMGHRLKDLSQTSLRSCPRVKHISK